MRRAPAIAAVVLLFVGLGIAFSPAFAQKKPEAESPKDPTLADFMRLKLAASNQILEGLVTENFGLVSKGAAKLGELSTAEKWRVINDSIYRQFTGEFQRSVEQLQKDAKDQKIDAASLTWIKTTMNCIECHKYTKGVLVTQP